MRIVVIGTVEFSRRALERLLAMHAEIVGVCTLQDSKFNADHVDLGAISVSHSSKINCGQWTFTNLSWGYSLFPVVMSPFGRFLPCVVRPQALRRLRPLSCCGKGRKDEFI
jgi:methionyl-tRNA formyltransferase